MFSCEGCEEWYCTIGKNCHDAVMIECKCKYNGSNSLKHTNKPNKPNEPNEPHEPNTTKTHTHTLTTIGQTFQPDFGERQMKKWAKDFYNTIFSRRSSLTLENGR